eukprot:TRINITY_DN2758_c0_g1_i1.p1 TRINITY_DN2758_c0_g1~~TRINITY_DN2758_c0_g1_i1.p1  ORF type:complete len:783 (-),score=254.08 TRINITY_DN2758_c0_g1_i1:1224-3545(-)
MNDSIVTSDRIDKLSNSYQQRLDKFEKERQDQKLKEDEEFKKEYTFKPNLYESEYELTDASAVPERLFEWNHLKDLNLQTSANKYEKFDNDRNSRKFTEKEKHSDKLSEFLAKKRSLSLMEEHGKSVALDVGSRLYEEALKTKPEPKVVDAIPKITSYAQSLKREGSIFDRLNDDLAKINNNSRSQIAKHFDQELTYSPKINSTSHYHLFRDGSIEDSLLKRQEETLQRRQKRIEDQKMEDRKHRTPQISKTSQFLASQKGSSLERLYADKKEPVDYRTAEENDLSFTPNITRSMSSYDTMSARYRNEIEKREQSREEKNEISVVSSPKKSKRYSPSTTNKVFSDFEKRQATFLKDKEHNLRKTKDRLEQDLQSELTFQPKFESSATFQSNRERISIFDRPINEKESKNMYLIDEQTELPAWTTSTSLIEDYVGNRALKSSRDEDSVGFDGSLTPKTKQLDLGVAFSPNKKTLFDNDNINKECGDLQKIHGFSEFIDRKIAARKKKEEFVQKFSPKYGDKWNTSLTKPKPFTFNRKVTVPSVQKPNFLRSKSLDSATFSYNYDELASNDEVFGETLCGPDFYNRITATSEWKIRQQEKHDEEQLQQQHSIKSYHRPINNRISKNSVSLFEHTINTAGKIEALVDDPEKYEEYALKLQDQQRIVHEEHQARKESKEKKTSSNVEERKKDSQRTVQYQVPSQSMLLSIKGYYSRIRDAEDLKRQQKEREDSRLYNINPEKNSWTPELTVPKEFKFNQKQQNIRSLKKPIDEAFDF